MQWIKSRRYECPPCKECDGEQVVEHRLRDDGALLSAKTRKINGFNLERFFLENLNEKSPSTGLSEDVFDAYVEKQMKENNGTEIVEGKDASIEDGI
jgi:hypothetical protein